MTVITPERQAILESDGFYDPADTHLDLSAHPEDHTVELNPDVISNLAVPPPPPVEPPAAVALPPEESEQRDEPQVYEYEDGSSVVIEKTKKGWKLVADSGTGKPAEVFYGANKDELLHNVAVGKLNATKKIQEQARTIKLGSFDQPAAQPQPEIAPNITSQELSADDIFTLKAQLEDNPALAFNTAFQKMTGFTMQQLTTMAKQGRSAMNELHREQMGREFKELNPDYLPVDQNYWAMVKWMGKYKLSKTVNEQTLASVLDELVDKGLYTTRTLTEAYEDLKESGLLVTAQTPQETVDDPDPVPTPAPAAAPAPVRRPRAAAANLGIRSTGAAPIKPVVEDAPKRIEDMSPEEVSAALAEVRKFKIRNPQEYALAQQQAAQTRR